MKRSIILIAVIALLLLTLLISCTKKVENELSETPLNSSAQVEVTEKVEVKPAPEMESVELASEKQEQNQTIDFSIEASACSAWQQAYVAFLEELCTQEAPARIAHSEGRDDANYELLSQFYCLYDINKDEVPEIFISFCNCSAGEWTEVFTVCNGVVEYLGEYSSGHSSLYSWPDDNGVLFDWAIYDNCRMDKISIVNGALVIKEIFTEAIAENREKGYTEPDEIVPGAVYLDWNRTTLNLPQYTPLTLPIYNYNPATSPSAVTGNKNNMAIQDVLTGNTELYGISANGFGGDTGWMYFEDYCQPGVASLYADQTLEIQKVGWLDFNNDGFEDCILLLGEPEEYAGSSDKYVILSEQDGIVYAYCINYSSDYEVYNDGTFAGDSDWTFKISFYKNQCYQYYDYSKSYDTNALAVEWQEYTDTLEEYENSDSDEAIAPIDHVLEAAISTNGPTYVFRLLGNKYTRTSGEFTFDDYRIDTIIITCEDISYYQELTFTKTLIRTSIDEDYSFELGDWNFDGYLDISLLKHEGGTSLNRPHYYWLWDSENFFFILNSKLEEISDYSALSIVDETQEIVAEYRLSTGWVTEYYQWQDNEILLIGVDAMQLNTNYDDGEYNEHHTVSELIDGQMVITQEYYE